MSETPAIDVTVTGPPVTVVEVTMGNVGVGIAAGGATGEALTKVDGSDFNTEWSDLSLLYSPLVHTHPISDITDLQTNLTNIKTNITAIEARDWVELTSDAFYETEPPDSYPRGQLYLMRCSALAGYPQAESGTVTTETRGANETLRVWQEFRNKVAPFVTYVRIGASGNTWGDWNKVIISNAGVIADALTFTNDVIAPNITAIEARDWVTVTQNSIDANDDPSLWPQGVRSTMVVTTGPALNYPAVLGVARINMQHTESTSGDGYISKTFQPRFSAVKYTQYWDNAAWSDWMLPIVSNASGIINLSDAPEYADDTAAGVGGLVAGDLYTTSGAIKIKL